MFKYLIQLNTCLPEINIKTNYIPLYTILIIYGYA